jgi:hypothetical protein
MSYERVEEPASDVLAAEVFAVPAPDPAFRSRVEPPTDVLAAEEFGVPAPDPGLCPEYLLLPADLVGNEPRDVLVAEEFAMPAPDEAHVRPPAVVRRGLPIVRLAAINLPPLLGAVWLFRRLRRRQSGS